MEQITPNDLLIITDNLTTEEITKKIRGSHPKALIPPFHLKDEVYTARCAEWVKNNFPSFKVGIVMPLVVRNRATQLLKLFQKEKYTPIVFHQDFPIIPWLPSLKKHLKESQWYHTCGMDINLFTGVNGHWTRGEML